MALLAPALVAAAAPAWGGERERLVAEGRWLQEELSLAGESKIYLMVDLGRGEMDLKAKGMVLRGMPIEVAGRWGDAVTMRRARLEKRSSLVVIERPEIKPAPAEGSGQPGGSSEEETPAPKALELADMPTRFDLYFDGGLVVRIKEKPEGFRSRLSLFWYGLRRGLARPIANLWRSFRRAPFVEISLVMAADDARSLFWSFPEGTEAVIFQSRDD